VPALVNWPGQLEPRKVLQPMHVVDWFPTLMKLTAAKLSTPLSLDGEDVWPWLTGDAPMRDRTFYIVWGGGRAREALRHGGLKILRNRPKAPWELYDLAADPYEKTNLAAKQPEVLERLRQVYQRERAADPR